jgi:hypothetical protein
MCDAADWPNNKDPECPVTQTQEFWKCLDDNTNIHFCYSEKSDNIKNCTTSCTFKQPVNYCKTRREACTIAPGDWSQCTDGKQTRDVICKIGQQNVDCKSCEGDTTKEKDCPNKTCTITKGTTFNPATCGATDKKLVRHGDVCNLPDGTPVKCSSCADYTPDIPCTCAWFKTLGTCDPATGKQPITYTCPCDTVDEGKHVTDSDRCNSLPKPPDQEQACDGYCTDDQKKEVCKLRGNSQGAPTCGNKSSMWKCLDGTQTDSLLGCYANKNAAIIACKGTNACMWPDSASVSWQNVCANV